VGDTDDVYFDPTHRFVYVIGGEGAVDVFRMSDPDHYEHAGRTNTASGARTGLFIPELDRLFVAVPIVDLKRQKSSFTKSRNLRDDGPPI
jgi:hypothetical protein